MTKQTVLGRVGQLSRANVSALLDQAEDPNAMLDRMVRDYRGCIRDADDAVAQTIARMRLMEQDHAEDVGAAAEWGGKARQALHRAGELRATGNPAAADRFERLARVALGRQVQCERDAAVAGPALTAQREVVDQLRDGLREMRQRLDLLQERREELLAEARQARAGGRSHLFGRARRAGTVATVDVLDPAGELARFEDKLRREDERAAGGGHPEESPLDGLYETPDLRADAAEIDARLARMRPSGSTRVV